MKRLRRVFIGVMVALIIYVLSFFPSFLVIANLQAGHPPEIVMEAFGIFYSPIGFLARVFPPVQKTLDFLLRDYDGAEHSPNPC